MNDYRDRASAILRQAEVSLRELLAESASSGDYASVIQITSIAKSLGSVASDLEGRTTIQRMLSPGQSDRRTGSARSARKPQRRKKAVRRSLKDGYPKFVRQGDFLIKIAWSKRDKKEYQHRAPRNIVRLLAGALRDQGRPGTLIASEEFLPLTDPADGSQVPSYQAYLALAWFVSECLIHREGRQGYIVGEPDLLESKAETAWGKLSVR